MKEKLEIDSPEFLAISEIQNIFQKIEKVQNLDKIFQRSVRERLRLRIPEGAKLDLFFYFAIKNPTIKTKKSL